jgi:adenine-specific DNA glycosylase
VARATGNPEALPNLGPRATSTARYFQAFLIEHQGKWLAVQRPHNVVNGQLWEFPNLEVEEAESDPALTARKLFGVQSVELTPFQNVRHSITRYRIALAAYRVRTPAPPARPSVESAQWLALHELERLPFTSAHRQLLRRVREVKCFSGR